MFDWEIKFISNNFNELKDNILKSKQIADYSNFINPKEPVKYINDFSDEFINNVKLAKEIVFESIKNNQPIIIHGDYDADGVISTHIIFSTIKNFLKYDHVYYIIPDRFEDGYGLSDKTVQKILDLVPSQNFLLITVDCGITSVNQVSFLKSLGNKVVITDHHHKGEVIPNSDSLIWSDKVVGSTLSWILSLALGNKDSKLLSLIATATITDVFPLKDFNRSIVKYGIEILKTNPFFPFKKLLFFHNIDLKDVNVYHLGFVIGPRLNSSGRIADADLSVSLLNSQQDSEIDKYLNEINLVNQRRQKITEESASKFSLNKENLPKVIIVKDEEFHEGVVGLIASRLVQNYHRPALVITQNEDFLKGSARSIKGINIIEIIKKFQHLLKGCGGHELAAGFSLERENFEEFKNLIESYIDENFDKNYFTKKIIVDSEISDSLITFETSDFIESLAPFGPGNEEPIFLLKEVTVQEIKKIGKDKNHLSLLVSKNQSKFKALYFNFPEEAGGLYLGQKINLIFKLKKNLFNNNTYLDLHILDIKEIV